MTLIERPVEERAARAHSTRCRRTTSCSSIPATRVKFGGDVCREFLEILPRLQARRLDPRARHFLPAAIIRRAWLIDQRLAFNEQYLLEAFLAFNRAFAVRAAQLSGSACDIAATAKALAPDGRLAADELGCGSFWMQRIA